MGLAVRTAQLPLAREWVGISCGRELRAGTIPVSLFFFSEDDRLPCPQRESPSKRNPWSFNRGRLQPLACPEQSLPLIGSNHLIRFLSPFSFTVSQIPSLCRKPLGLVNRNGLFLFQSWSLYWTHNPDNRSQT